MSLGIIKVVQMNEASSSGVGIGKVSPVRRRETTFNTTAWVVVGASASTVEVAEGWEIGSGSGGDGETGSLIIKGTCSLDLGVRVVSIEEDSVGRAGPVDFRIKNFCLESRAGGTLGGLRDLRFFTSSWPGTRATLVLFAGIGPMQAAFPEMLETWSSDFSSLMEVRLDRFFAVRLFCFSSLESDRLLGDLPPQTGMSRSAMSPIADEAESIIPGTCWRMELANLSTLSDGF